jgi:hypothetical protein
MKFWSNMASVPLPVAHALLALIILTIRIPADVPGDPPIEHPDDFIQVCPWDMEPDEFLAKVRESKKSQEAPPKGGVK